MNKTEEIEENRYNRFGIVGDLLYLCSMEEKEEKQCPKCGEIKPLDEFGNQTIGKNGKNPRCKLCVNKYFKNNRLKNIEIYKIKEREKYKKSNANEKKKIYFKIPKNKERSRIYAIKYHLKNKYNMTLEDYNNMFNIQEGKCAICGIHQSEIKRTFVVDHCHETGNIRSILCNSCNSGLGMFKEDINILKLAIDYIEKHSVERIKEYE